jgi:hypothetical protein
MNVDTFFSFVQSGTCLQAEEISTAKGSPRPKGGGGDLGLNYYTLKITLLSAVVT